MEAIQMTYIYQQTEKSWVMLQVSNTYNGDCTVGVKTIQLPAFIMTCLNHYYYNLSQP